MSDLSSTELLSKWCERLERQRHRRKAQSVLEHLPRRTFGDPTRCLVGWWQTQHLPAKPTRGMLQLVASFLTDPNPHVRLATARALSKTEPDGEITLDPLIAALEDDFPAVRTQALRSLYHIPKFDDCHRLRSFENEDDTLNRRLAARIVVRASQASHALDVLFDAVEDGGRDFCSWLRSLTSADAASRQRLHHLLASDAAFYAPFRDKYTVYRLRSFWIDRWRHAFGQSDDPTDSSDAVIDSLRDYSKQLDGMTDCDLFLGWHASQDSWA